MSKRSEAKRAAAKPRSKRDGATFQRLTEAKTVGGARRSASLAGQASHRHRKRRERQWLALLVLLSGCPDPMAQPDGGTGPIDTGVKTILFEAERIEGPSLAFGAHVLASDRLDVDLVASGLMRAYGIAYRIQFDPAVLGFDRLDRSTSFIHDDLFEVKEAEPGLLIVAMSAVGPHRGIDLDGAVIARLGLIRKTGALTELRIARPFALDEEGAELFLRSGKGAIVER